MNPQKFVLHLSGASCSGKSTIGALLAESLPGIYVVSHDKLKWQLSGYERDKDMPLMRKILQGFFEVVCKQGVSVLLDAIVRNEEDYQYFKDVAEANGYRFISVKLTAPKEVLLKRFRERIENGKKNNIKISITSEELFLANIENEFFTPEGTPTFDTSEANPAEVVSEILALVR